MNQPMTVDMFEAITIAVIVWMAYAAWTQLWLALDKDK